MPNRPAPPAELLAACGRAFARLRWEPVAGGFSGAAVFCGFEGATPGFALKAWPAEATAERVAFVHRRMALARQAGLSFVPHVLSPLTHAGAFWELSTWMPGTATRAPTAAQQASACTALARLHRIWRPTTVETRPFPAVARRLALLAAWRSRFDRTSNAEFRDWVVRAESMLAPLADRRVAVQPCLCDVHAAHMLFTGDEITGVVDYASMKYDHPAVDLARWLGDLETDSPFNNLSIYRAAGGSPEVTADLVNLLEVTGTIGALARWALVLEGREPSAALAARQTRLVNKLRSITDALSHIRTLPVPAPAGGEPEGFRRETTDR